MNQDWIQLRNIQETLNELLNNKRPSVQTEDIVLLLVNEIPKETVFELLTKEDSFVSFRWACLLRSLLTKVLCIIVAEFQDGLTSSKEEIVRQRLERLLPTFQTLNLFTVTEPVFLYRICRFYAGLIDDVRSLLLEHSINEASLAAILVFWLERLIWRQRDMLSFPDWNTLTSIPYVFASYLVLFRKWLSFLSFICPQYHISYHISNLAELVRYGNGHPVFYVRQRCWEVLLELQRIHTDFSKVILEESCKEEVLSMLTTLLSEEELNNWDSYFGYQADSVPNIATKKVFVRYYILGIVSSLTSLVSNESFLNSNTFYYVQRVERIFQSIASQLALWCVSPKSHRLEYYLVLLFTDQDDLMCLFFLQVLKLYQVCLNCEEEQRKTSFSLSIHSMFFSWLYQIDFDEQVLLDFINSSETEFLTFFVKYLNILLQTKLEYLMDDIHEFDFGRFTVLLENLCSVLQRLQNKNLIAFRCDPLVRKMRRVLEYILPISSIK